MAVMVVIKVWLLTILNMDLNHNQVPLILTLLTMAVHVSMLLKMDLFKLLSILLSNLSLLMLIRLLLPKDQLLSQFKQTNMVSCTMMGDCNYLKVALVIEVLIMQF